MTLGIPVPAGQRKVRGCLSLNDCGMGCPARTQVSIYGIVFGMSAGLARSMTGRELEPVA
jgi:hypothetical protein